MRYEDFSANLLRIGQGRGIPAVTAFSASAAAVSSLVSVTLTPASVATITVAAQTLTGIPGVEANDLVFLVRHPIVTAVACTGVIANGANSISMTFVNPTGLGVIPTSGTYTFLIFKTQ